MRARHWALIAPLVALVVGGGLAATSDRAVAAGRQVQSMVVVDKVIQNGVAVSFTASGALASARADDSGAGQEEIGCWTVDGQSLTCFAKNSNGSQVACIVADSAIVNGVRVSLGYVARLAALNGDSFVQFAGAADNPASPLTSYSCTSMRVENRSIYSPKQ